MDALGSRMKLYEKAEAGRKFMPLLPINIRIDGKRFSRFTHGLERPYDKRLSDLMIKTTEYLVKQTGAVIGYTQSDEISLVLYSNNDKTQTFLNGKIHKLVSIIASMTTAFFNKNLQQYLPEKSNQLAMFDCRAWQMPTLEESSNAILWREFDATKNSISMAASHYYSHKKLFKKHAGEQLDLLLVAGVNWNKYPAFFKRGTFVQRKTIIRKFWSNEIDLLPPKHEARSNPNLMVERTDVVIVDMPPFGKVTNRIDVIFHGADPITDSEN